MTVIRGLSLGEIEYGDVPKVIWKEIRVALLCGIALAAANFVKLMIFDRVGVAVAVVVCITLVAAVVSGYADQLSSCPSLPRDWSQTQQ